MDLEYSDEQRLLSETLRKFLGTGYAFDARGKITASAAGFSEDVWAALAEMGILGVPFDAVYGGFGGTTIDMLIVFEALGEALVVEPYLATVGLGARFVARGGSAEQRARILPALIQGKLKMAFAQTEHGARWDLRHVATRAARAGDGYVLDGEKSVVLHGGAADLLVVSARTSGGERDASGISLFLVERGAPGVSVSEYRTLDNLRVADVKLAGVRVGADALLGREGHGFELADEVVDYATALVCAQPIFAGLIALFLGRSLPRLGWIGIAVATLGTALIAGADLGVSVRALAGDLLALAGGLAAAVYVTLGAAARARMSTAAYTAGCYATCAVLLLGASVIGGVHLTGFSGNAWLKIVLVTVCAQLLGHTLINVVLHTTSPTAVSLALLLETPGAALVAYFWLHQRPPLSAAPGLALLLGGLVLVVRTRAAPADID